MAQFLNQLSVTPVNQRLYRLLAPLKYQSDILSNEDWVDVFDDGCVTVPADTITDMASIPFPVNRFLKPYGPWKRAAVVHDYLCKQFRRQQPGPLPDIQRRIADSVFYEAMRADGINVTVAFVFWVYVRLYGILF